MTSYEAENNGWKEHQKKYFAWVSDESYTSADWSCS